MPRENNIREKRRKKMVPSEPIHIPIRGIKDKRKKRKRTKTGPLFYFKQ